MSPVCASIVRVFLVALGLMMFAVPLSSIVERAEAGRIEADHRAHARP